MKAYLIIFTFLSMNFLVSCSSSKITNDNVLNGFWLTEERFGGIDFHITYYALSFKIDSFFLEVGELRQADHSKNPLRAKGVYEIAGEFLTLKGSVKYESNNSYKEGYSEIFEYLFSGNSLMIQSLNNRYSNRFILKKMSNTPKTF